MRYLLLIALLCVPTFAQATTTTAAAILWPYAWVSAPDSWEVEGFARDTREVEGGIGQGVHVLNEGVQASSHITNFAVSGQGAGTITITVPYELFITRSELTVGRNNVAFVSLFGEGFTTDSKALGWADELRNGENEDFPHIRLESALQISRDFVNPNRTTASFETLVRASAQAERVPEPSTWLLLACGLIGFYLYRLRTTPA